MKSFFILVLLLFTNYVFSQTVSGLVTDEDQNPLPAVLVINMATEQKVYTNIKGEFSITTSENNELRFVRQGFERSSIIIRQNDFNVSIILIRAAQEIEEVEVSPLKLTGDLNQDSRNLTKIDRSAQVEKAVGVPNPPEKPREKPADVKKDILMPLLSLSPSLNVQAIYDVLSGKARKQKSWYKYEDLQDHVKWIRQRIPDDYFVEIGIPQEKISEFLQFSIGQKPEIVQAIKATNVSKVVFLIEETLPKYLNNK